MITIRREKITQVIREEYRKKGQKGIGHYHKEW